MKLAILRGSAQYVNPEYYNVQEIGLAKILASHGWSVQIVSSGPETRITEPAKGVEWVECRRVGVSKNLAWPEKAVERIHEFNPDIIQVQDILTPSTFLAAKARNSEGIPLVLSMGEYPEHDLVHSTIRRFVALYMRGKYAAVLSKTRVSALYSESLGLQNVTVCPVGIDPGSYEANPNEELLPWLQLIREKQAKGKKFLCHVGRLDKLDNIPFLTKVLSYLPNDYELLVAGEPIHYAQRIARESGVVNRCNFVGSVPNRLIGSIFTHSMASLSCSTFEPFGLSALESLYFGCPVFAYPTGGIKDIITHEKTGFHIEQRNPDLWAKRIVDAVESGALKKLSNLAETEKTELTWDYRALAYEAVYHDVINQRGALV